MRRFPISWDRTLTALGFRRRVNRFKRRRYGRLTSRHELLEVRALLSATQHELPDDAIVTAAYSVGPTFAPIRPEYVLAGSAAGDTPGQFEVTTEYSASGEPLAVLRLKDDLVRIDRSLQELTIELRLGETVLTRHEVLIDIADDLFVHEFREAREQEAADASASFDLVSKSPRDWVATLGADGYFNDLRPTSSRQTQSSQALNLNEDSATTSSRDAQRNTESIARLAQIAKNSSVELLDKAAKVSFYAGIEQAVGGASQRRSDLDESHASQNDRLIGGLALAYGRQIAQDLKSGDSEIALAAARSRDTLLAAVDPYYTMLTGMDVNQTLTPQDGSSGIPDFTMYMVEEPSLEIDGVIRIDLGGAKAMVQVTTSGTIQGAVARSLPVLAHVPPNHDTLVYADGPTANYDASGLYAWDYGLPDRVVSLLGFDLSEYAGSVPTNASLKLTATHAASGSTVSVSAHKDLWGVDPLSDWDESTLTYNEYASDLEAGFGSVLDTQSVSAGLVSFDVTEAIQRALLLGDSNLNGVLDPAGPAGDIAAFYLATTDFNAYAAQYAGLELSGVTNGYLFRNDANVDGVVDRFDVGTYFKRVGVKEGDFNIDGVVDGRDYAIWSANYGSTTAKFAGGDGSFDGVVNALDYTVWRDNVGQAASDPTDPEVSFRLLAGYLSDTAFYDSEYGIAPELTVDVAPRVVINNFGTDTNGALQVTYEVQHDVADDAELTLYQVVDGVRTPLLTSVSLNEQVGVHVATLPNSFLIPNPDGDYTLVAEIESASSVTTWRPFTGGVFATADGAIHAIGTAGDDTVLMTDSAIAVSAPGLGVLGFVEFFDNYVPLYVHTGDGDDVIQIEKFYADEIFLSGGSGADTYAFASVYDVLPTVRINDPTGIDELRLNGSWSASSQVDLDSNALQAFAFSASSADALLLQLVGSPIDVVTEFPIGQIAGRGYSYDIVVENTSDVINHTDGSVSLREALDTANAIAASGKPQIIGFAPEMFDSGVATITLTYKATPTLQAPEQLEILDDVTIVGPGPDLLQISGGGLTRVFYVAAGADASIQGLTVRDGRSAAGYVNGYPVVGSFGGGIYNEGSLHLNDVVVRDNLAVHGGGVYSTGDTSIYSSSIINNNVYYSVGGVFQWYGNLTIVDTEISANDSVYGGAPGGLWVVDAATINLDGLTVAENQTLGMGGIGIATNIGATTTGTLKNSLIRDNEVEWTGGGIGFALSGVVDFKVENTTISGNKAGHGGGGVNFEGRPTGPGVKFTNVTIFDNTVTGIGTTTPQGGGIRIEDRFGGSDGTKVSLYNTIVAGNYVDGSESNIAGGVNLASSHNLIGLGGSGGLVHNPSGALANQVEVSSTGVGPLSGNYASDGFHPLTATSPAIDAASDALASAIDQRGRFRHDYAANGRVSDIGAYEYTPRQYVAAGGTVTLPALTGDLLSLVPGAGDYRVSLRAEDELAGNFLGESTATGANLAALLVNLSAQTFRPHDYYSGPLQVYLDISRVNNGAPGPVRTVLLSDLFVYPEVFVVNSLGDGADATSLADGVADTGSRPYGREVTLRAAIEEAQALRAFLLLDPPGSGNPIISDPEWTPTIRFDKSLGATARIELNPSLGHINITSSLKINGSGVGQTIIDANGKASTPNRAFSIASGSSVEISGVTITGGWLAANGHNGGAILSEGDLVIRNVELSDNITHGRGGAIYSGAAGSLSIYNSTLTRNTAWQGGAVHDEVRSAGPLYIEGSTISHNRIERFGDTSREISVGGAILAWGENGGTERVSIVNSTIAYNKSDDSNGGLDIAKISDVRLVHNTAVGNHSAETYSPANAAPGVVVRYSGEDSSSLVAKAYVYNNLFVGNTYGTSRTKFDFSRSAVAGSGSTVEYGGNVATNVPASALAGFTIDPAATNTLSSLGDHGGGTHTIAIVPEGSSNPVALNFAVAVPSSLDLASVLSADQRGTARAVGSASDAGAFEYVLVTVKGDFDGDGRIDTLSIDSDSSDLFFTSGLAGSSPKLWGNAGDAVNTLRVGDFNGDGRDDVAFRNVAVWTFALSESNRFLLLETGDNPHWFGTEVLVGDFDGDGRDELLGRWNGLADSANPDPTFNEWETIEYEDEAGFNRSSVGESLIHVSNAYRGNIFVGDVNGDGIDDLVASVNPAESSDPQSSTNPPWVASISDGSGLVCDLIWGDWFDSYYDASGDSLNTEAPYAKVVDIFNFVRDEVELELYGGFLKGVTATRETRRGSAWDQAALLEAELTGLGLDATIGMGKVTAAAAEVVKWLGVPANLLAEVDPYDAIEAILRKSIDPNATLNSNGTFTFEHAWVEVAGPQLSGSNTPLVLDPAWNIAAVVDAYGAESGGPIVPFNLIEYLTLDSRTTSDTPLEFYESNLIEFLAEAGDGISIADIGVKRVSGLDSTSRQRLDAGFGYGVNVTTQHEPADNLLAITSDPVLAAQWTHTAEIDLQNTPPYSGPYLDDPLIISIAEHSLSEISINYKVGAVSVVTIDAPNHDPLFPVTSAVIPTNIPTPIGVTLAVTLQQPSRFAQTQLAEEPLLVGLTSSMVVTVNFDALQYSAASVERSRKGANMAVADLADPEVQAVAVMHAAAQSALTTTNLAYTNIGSLFYTEAVTQRAGAHLNIAKAGYVNPVASLPFGVAPSFHETYRGNRVTNYLSTTTGTTDSSAQALAGIDAEMSVERGIEEALGVSRMSGYRAVQRGAQRVLGSTVLPPAVSGQDAAFSLDVSAFTDNPSGTDYVSYTLRQHYRDSSGSLVNVTVGQRVNYTTQQLYDELLAIMDGPHDFRVRQRILSELVAGGKGVFYFTKYATGELLWNGFGLVTLRPDGRIHDHAQRINSSGQDVAGGNLVANEGTAIAISDEAERIGFRLSRIGNRAYSGAVDLDVLDIAAPNSGVSLSFARQYNSQSKRDVGVGVGWTHSFSDRLIRTAVNSDNLVWYTSEGLEHIFEFVGGVYVSPSQLLGELVDNGNDTLSYISRDGMRVTFAVIAGASGEVARAPFARLESKLDVDGNGILVTYESSAGDKIDNVRDVHTPNRRLEISYIDVLGATQNHIQRIEKHYYDESSGTLTPAVVPDPWRYSYTTIGSDKYLVEVDYASTDFPGDDANDDIKDAYAYYSSTLNVDDAAAFDGLLKSRTTPSGDVTSYDYYVNRQVFQSRTQVSPGKEHVETYAYDLVNGKTSIRDANGNETIYSYNDEGLVTRVINPDRTRQESEWGVEYTGAAGQVDSDLDGVVDGTEYLQVKAIDEVGAVASFEYYTSTTADDTTAGGYERELHRSTSKHFPQADGVTLQYGLVTEYKYVTPGDTVRVKERIVDPDGDPRTTVYNYDEDLPIPHRGKLTSEINALGQRTIYTYHGTAAGASDGLLKSITTPSGHDENGTGSRTYYDVLKTVDVLSGTLTVTLESALDAVGAAAPVVVDAVRLDRWDSSGEDPDAVQQTFIVDDSSSGFSWQGTRTVVSASSAGTGWGLTDNSATLFAAGEVAASNATWTFDGLPAGQYRVSVILAGATGVPVPVSTIYSVLDGNVPRSVDPADNSSSFWSHQTTFAYDSAGNVINRRLEGRPATVTTAYHHTGQPLSVTDATGRVTRSVFDDLGRLRQTILDGDIGTADDLVTTYSYDPSGRPTTVIDALGRQATTEYDGRGLVTKVTYADGSFVTHAYDGAGNRTSTTDALGRTTRFNYDSRNRLVQTIAPDGSTEQMRYDGVGRLVESTDALGRKAQFTYNAAGSLLQSIAAAETVDTSISRSKHNVFGEVIETVDGEGNVTQFFYDQLGRVVKTMVLKDGSIDLGDLLQSDPNNKRPIYVDTTAYDPNGNAVEKIIYDTRDTAGRISTADLLVEDLRDRLDGHNGVLGDADDLAGLVATAYLRTGQAYDNFNRPTVTTYDDGSASSVEYDSAGRVRFTENELGARSERRYDEYGRLVATILPDPDTETGVANGQGPTSTQSYDAVGNVVAMVDPNGNTTAYSYDLLNRRVSMTDAVGSTSRSVFDKAGQLVAIVDALGVAVATRYDERGRAIRRSWVAIDPDQGGTEEGYNFPSETYVYDAIGNLVATTDTRGYQSYYVYDNRNRLVEERSPRTHLDGDAVRLGDAEPDLAGAYIGGADLRDQDIRTRYTYDAVGNKLSTEAFVYDSLVRIDLARTDYEYDELNRQTVERLADPDGSGDLKRRQFRKTYDGYSNVVVVYDEEADSSIDFRIDTFAYDQRNRLIEEVFVAGEPNEAAPDKLRNVYEYDLAGNLIALKKAVRGSAGAYIEGEETVTTRYEYDPLKRVKAEHFDAPFAGHDPDAPGKHTSTYAYDAVGNRILNAYTVRQGTNSRSVVTSYEYDELNRPTAAIEDVGGIEATSRTSYDAVGNVVLEIDATGIATTYAYDDLYRLVKTTYGDPQPYDGEDSALIEKFEYDIASNLAASINGENNRTEYKYNTFGQVIEERVKMPVEPDPNAPDPDIVTVYWYNGLGDRTHVIDPNDNVTKFEYDLLQRVIKETQGDSDNGSNSRAYHYETSGNLESVVDRNGRQTIYGYDRLDRLTTEKWYVTEGGVHTDTLGWQYDKLGRVKRTFHTDVTSSSSIPDVAYDAYVYDGLDRVTARYNYEPTWNRAANQFIGPEVRQTYNQDKLDLLLPGELNATEYVLTYEPRQSGTSFNVNYAQSTNATDRLGRLARITEATGSVIKAKDITYVYDATGRMTSVARRADKNGNRSVFDVNPTGGNTDNDFYFSTFYGYDPAGRLDAISHARIADGAVFASYAYDYDNASRVSEINATTRFTWVSLDRQETQTYDAAGRLKLWSQTLVDFKPSADLPNGVPARNLGDEAYFFTGGTVDFAPDAAGNLNHNGQNLGDETHNRIDEDVRYDYEYDNEGNLFTRTDLSNGDISTYTWDHRNRLIAIKTKNTADVVTSRVEYRYNTDDLRTRKVVFSDDLTIESVEHYVYDGAQLVAVLDGDWNTGEGSAPDTPNHESSFQRRVQTGPGTDEALFDEVYRVAGVALSSSELYWAATDHAGSVRDVLRNTHDLVNHIEYDAYGDTMFAVDHLKTDVDPDNNHQTAGKYLYKELAVDAAFAGREWDEDAGLYYNRARWYDAAQGRFISEDPVGFAGGDTNVYRYGGGDPVNFYDPSGMFLDKIWRETERVFNDVGDFVEDKYKETVQSIEYIARNPEDAFKSAAKNPWFWAGLAVGSVTFSWGFFNASYGLGGFSNGLNFLDIGRQALNLAGGNGFSWGLPTVSVNSPILNLASSVINASLGQLTPEYGSAPNYGIALAGYDEPYQYEGPLPPEFGVGMPALQPKGLFSRSPAAQAFTTSPAAQGIALPLVDRFNTTSQYLGDSLKQVVLGDYYNGDPTIGGVSGQIGAGLLGIDLPGDIRDLTHSVTNWEWTWGHAGNTALNVAGLFPVIGVVKYGDEVISLAKRTPNPLNNIERAGSALKQDPHHAFPDIVDNFVGDAQKYLIPTKGPGGIVVRESELYQLPGSLRGDEGVFEWVVDQGQVTHRRFIPGGKTTGYPNQVPIKKQ